MPSTFSGVATQRLHPDACTHPTTPILSLCSPFPRKARHLPPIPSNATPAQRRYCRFAIAAFVFGFLGPPIYWGVLPNIVILNIALGFNTHQMIFATLILLPLSAIYWGAVSLWRIKKSRGNLRGAVFALLGIAASILWPLSAALFYLSKLSQIRP
jgi:hypothetical protein